MICTKAVSKRKYLPHASVRFVARLKLGFIARRRSVERLLDLLLSSFAILFILETDVGNLFDVPLMIPVWIPFDLLRGSRPGD